MTLSRRSASVLHHLALASLLLILAEGAVAEEAGPRQFQLDGRTIAIPVPSGYCPADRSKPAMELVVSTIERAFPENIRMLTVDFDCAGMDVLLSGASQQMPPYVVHLVLLNPDGMVATYPGPRRDFLAIMSASLTSADGQEALNSVKESAKERLQRAFDELNELAETPLSLQSLQMRPGLGDDTAGTYVGVVGKIQDGSNTAVIAGVGGVTLINGVVMTVNVYRLHDSPSTFDRLLSESQSFTAGLVRANDPQI